MANFIEAEELFSKLNQLGEEDILEFIKESLDYSAEELLTYIDYTNEYIQGYDTGLKIIDCCGTGGDQSATFNISTASAIVAASTGIKIAKNGGRAASSQSGSVDLLEAFGLDISKDFNSKLKLLNDRNLAFFPNKRIAELFSPIKTVAKKHKVPCFVSLIGPFSHELHTTGQLIGVGKEEWLERVIEISIKIQERDKNKKFLLVQSKYQKNKILDEVSSASQAVIYQINSGKLLKFELKVEDLGLKLTDISDLQGKDPQYNANLIESVFQNYSEHPIAITETIAMNAALIHYIAQDQLAKSQGDFLKQIQEFFELNMKAICSGEVAKYWAEYKFA